MASDAEFFADARTRMVDSQIRPNKVVDPRILNAMRTLPREQFLPAALAPLAYSDEDVPLGHGRFLMEPMVLARLIQAAEPVAGEVALVVGAGVGYGAAVLAACGVRVTAVEEDPALFARAQSTLAAVAPSISVVQGPLAAGWAAGAPFDIILLEGAVRAIPPALVKQVRLEGGRVVGVLAGPGRSTGQAVLAELSQGGLRAAPIFDCATPLLPSLILAPAFVF
jgi:protein-L-isoaspartate(D-aspartate) O-methyltransferase